MGHSNGFALEMLTVSSLLNFASMKTTKDVVAGG
jgi:hypothetical protein